jgi:hypothetical protein
MAGLLTFSLSDAFPFCTVIFLGALQWLVVQKVWYEITAAVLSGIYTRFPINPDFS